MSRRTRKTFNLAERTEVIELKKRLYVDDEVKHENRSSIGEAGASGSSSMAELSSTTERLFPQE